MNLNINYDDIYMVEEQVWRGADDAKNGIIYCGTFQFTIVTRQFPMDGITFHDRKRKYAKIKFLILPIEVREFIKDSVVANVAWDDKKKIHTYTYMLKEDMNSIILNNNWCVGDDGRLKIQI